MHTLHHAALKMVPLVLALSVVFLLGADGSLTTVGAVPIQGQNFPNLQLEPVFHPMPENVEILKLENGLQVILMRNPSQPMVGIYTQIKTGSAWENYRTSGMTHLLEHLIFNGSEKYTQEEQYEMADRAGAYNNANTSDFYTNFMLILPSDKLETGLDLQTQMLLHSTLPQEKFDKDKGIVLGEILTRYERERQPETLVEASGYMKRLTNGGYQRIWTPLGKEILFVDTADGESLPVEVLSRGTREQLFLRIIFLIIQ